MQLALNGQQLGSTHQLAQLVEVIQSFGVQAMEIWPHNLAGGETDEEKIRYEKKDIAGARRVLESAGMQLACVTLGFNAIRICTGIGGVQRATDALKGTVDAAAALGAKIVNCYLAYTPPQLFVQAMQPAAAYAASQGVTIVLENEAHDESATPEGVLALIEQVGSPGFATEYDPCNYYHAYEEPYPKAYEILKAHIRYVHLKGGVHYDERWQGRRGSLMRGQRDRYIGYVPLPEAAFNVDAIIRRLARDRYQGFVTLEPHVPPEQVLDFYKVEVPYLQARLATMQRPT
jgi:sugar phosphate isomerase/epimerase